MEKDAAVSGSTANVYTSRVDAATRHRLLLTIQQIANCLTKKKSSKDAIFTIYKNNNTRSDIIL